MLNWPRPLIKQQTTSEPQFTSHAEWPPECYTNAEGRHESPDTHGSREAALSVCSLLHQHGFGGNGEYFPITNWSLVGTKATYSNQHQLTPQHNCLVREIYANGTATVHFSNDKVTNPTP